MYKLKQFFKRISKISGQQILIISISICIISITVLGAGIGSVLNRINYEEPTTLKVNQDSLKQFDEEEQIDFSFDDYEVTEVQDISEITSDNSPTDTPKRTQTTKATTQTSAPKLSSESLVAIYSVNNGKTEKIEVPAQELKKKAAEIQKIADEDIEQNIAPEGDVWYSNDVYNFLIVGYDAGMTDETKATENQFNRSDSIIIASLNKKQKTIKLVSLSRATYVAVDGHGNRRINAAFGYGGINKLIETIEMNYKVRIDNYAVVNFAGFENIINAMNGIKITMTDIEASFAFDKETPAGTYTLNGHQALRYVRLRKTDSDRTRTGRQRKMLKAMYARFKNMTIAEDIDFLDAVFPYISTDLSKTQLIAKATEAQNYKDYPVTEDIIPHKAVQLSMRDGLEVLILDWEETTSYLHEILYKNVTVKKDFAKKVA